jgi:hypothetical protein
MKPCLWRCFHGTMDTKMNHNLTIFTTIHFLCAFLNIWKTSVIYIMQLKVDNIVNSHYGVKLMHIWIMQWLIGIHFRVCHKHYNITKGLKKINFNGDMFMKVFTYEKTTVMNNLFHENLQFVLKTWCSY